MNILFVFSRHSKDVNDSTLTKDLAHQFVEQGHSVYIITLLEKRCNEETQLSVEDGCHVLRVKVGNYFNTGRVEKLITTMTMSDKLVCAAKKYFRNIHFDTIVTHTPFVSNASIIRPLKKVFNCPSQLILWDIFPQNAWDLGLIKSRVVFNFFKRQERKMLCSYEHIWCMSDGNVKYVQEHYSYVAPCKISKLYNSAKIVPSLFPDKQIRFRYGFEDDEVISIFGGNMGKPQKLKNILKLARLVSFKGLLAKFVFVGSGAEIDRIKKLSQRLKVNNVVFLDQMPRADYEQLTAVCDIGLVSLDERFTVPNFPSKTTDYFKLGLPILASLDSCALQDYGDFLVNIAKAGLAVQAGKPLLLFKEYLKLYDNITLRKQLGENGRKFYETELDVKITCSKIISKIHN